MTDTENGKPGLSHIRKNVFIEVDYYLERKQGQNADGDVFLSRKNATGSRIVAALSDGLGSGVKANILASLTATMLTEFVLKDIPPRNAAELIINSLPVCRKRGLGYATFALADIRHDMTVNFIEYESPPVTIVRENRLVRLEKTRIPIERKNKKTGPEDEALFCSAYSARPGDRIIFFSDGVTQAGIGKEGYPGGWGAEQVQKYALSEIENRPLASARELAQSVVAAARLADGGAAHDDIGCGVIYFREPRDLLVVTGPPFHEEDDREMARVFERFAGQKVILGGTTAKIIARELGKTIRTPFDLSEMPAISLMDGADLVCEGVLTLEA
ncbi:MAG: serine/threonine-protein phosphatase, partial [Spirochaetaceae bacterium]|nr:serine/threonine-protein phosphatase [Spirochaetaceae bacterium]